MIPSILALALSSIFICRIVVAADALTVESDFEGASVSEVEIDNAARSISFRPGGDPMRGWPCWWFFRVKGITPGETITLRLQGSKATTATGWTVGEAARIVLGDAGAGDVFL